MRISEAIKKAMNAGWRDNGKVNGTYAKILLDPLFWQALGHAIGKDNPDNFMDGESTLKALSGKWWLEDWHKFIDSLAEGKTPDSYFKSLN